MALYWQGDGSEHFPGIPARDLTKPESDQLAADFDMSYEDFSAMLRKSGLYAGRKPDKPGASVEEYQEAEWAEDVRMTEEPNEPDAEKPAINPIAVATPPTPTPAPTTSTAARAAATAAAVKGG